MGSIFDVPRFAELLDGSSQNQAEGLPAVDLYRNGSRRKEREYIEAVFARLPEGSYKSDLQRRFLSPNTSDYLGAWYELMVYDWLDGLGKNPVLQPLLSTGKSKPDFEIRSDELQSLIEVTVVQQSSNDSHIDRGRVWWPAAIATFETMRNSLIRKIGQHSIPPGMAYVICLCLETDLIDIEQVKTCFLGGESAAVATRELLPRLDGEVFENHPGMPLLVKHRDVSALLVARRNRTTVDDGFRLLFGLVQNPYAHVRIPDTEFGNLRRYTVIAETETRLTMGWLGGTG
jgi:hypothetical protein